jgi:hypothetical protein
LSELNDEPTSEEIPMATWNRFVNLIEVGTSVWHRQSLRRAHSEAKYALGERMYAAGIDDGQLVAQIAVLDQKIRQAETSKCFTTVLMANRRVLLLQLATAALEEESPLPGADGEYQKARKVEEALQAYSEPGGPIRKAGVQGEESRRVSIQSVEM